MKTILYNPIFINPQAYYVFPRLTRYLQPDNESTAEPANYIGTIEVKVIAYGDTTLKRTYTNTDSIDLSEFKNTWIRISLFTKVGSCVLGEWKIGNMESDLPYIDPEVLASLKAVVIVGNKTNNDSDRAIVKNLVDASNPFVISNASYNLNSGYGKYNITFQHFPYRENIISINDNKVVFDKGGQLLLPYPSMDRDIPSFKVKVSGLSGTYHFRYYYRDSNGAQDSINMAKDGIYELPICYNVQSSSDGRDCGFANNGNDVVTITQIPSFEGAFVTDGIDDLITSTKTVQEMLGGSNEITVVSMIHQIDGNVNYTNGYTNYIRHGGGFIRNSVSGINGKGFNKTGIYGYTSTQLNSSNMGLGNVINNILGDKDDYSFERSSTYTLDDAKYSVQNFVNANNQPSNEGSSIAWYWTIIANKVLTTDQINQVIAYFNLDRTLRPDILCNIIKQGITNENHAEFGDKLIDFSDNGRDIQLNNIAWKGDSGIGKYEVDFLDSSIWNSSNSTITSSKIDCKNAISHIMLLYYSVGSKEYPDIPSFKVIKTGADIDYSYIDETGSPKSVRIVDGVNVLPASHNTLYSGSGRFCGFGNPGMGNSVTITQIPSHAGALCLDGVNDFGKVTGMPIYKDYTVVANYQRLSQQYVTGIGGTCSVSKSHIPNQGAFVMDAGTSSFVKTQCYSFGALSPVLTIDNSISCFHYQTKYIFDKQDINKGEGIDSDVLWLGTFRDNDQRFFNGAIYSLMSFPYSMSEFLIERQLKKHKLGTLYPDMVEFRPVIKANANYNIFYTALLPLTGIVWEKINIGDYIPVGRRVAIQLSFDNEASELVSAISSQLDNISITKNSNNKGYTIFGDILKDKSPQKINITIDEYIRYEDIVQPYPVLLRFNDENGNEVSWGGKFRVGSTITRIGSAADSNLLPNIYNIFGLLLNDNQVTSSKVIVEKTMVFKAKSAYIFDNNEPNCILSPRLLRIPNSSYKILGYIPDISGHGNHGVIHNSAYGEGSGVNEDGSYQFDGVDDFVTIPTVTGGGKQVLMKVNNNTINSMLYDQRSSGASPNSLYNDFAIYCTNSADNNQIAYQSRLVGNTYIDGILNTNITCEDLLGVLHNITITCDIVVPNNGVVPNIGRGGVLKDLYSKVALYDFMLFDNISTEDKIKELNEYVGIEAKVELPPYYWDAYGKTNLDADKAIIQQRGVAVGDYDLTNNNFAYEGMSGYNGYPAVFGTNKTYANLVPNDGNFILTSSHNIINVTKFDTSYGLLYSHIKLDGKLTSRNIDYPSYKIKVTGLGENFGLHYSYLESSSDTTVKGFEINNDGIYIIPKSFASDGSLTSNSDWIGFIFTGTAPESCNVTIEVLPEYENGLVYDGVTDYSENANIPALTDYTYIFKRDILGFNPRSVSMHKGTSTNAGRAFTSDYDYGETNEVLAYSFGSSIATPNATSKKIIYGTKTSVDGQPITPGSNIDDAGLFIGKWYDDFFKKMVFYKLILYPKTIPLLQINFLKNLMEKDEIIDLNNKIFIQE